MSTSPYVPIEIVRLRQRLEVISSAVEANLEGIDHETALRVPKPRGNHINWVMGHMVHSIELVITTLDLESVLPENELGRYRRGSPPIEDHAEAIPLDRLISAWVAAVECLDQRLLKISVDRLEQRVDGGGHSGTTLASYLDMAFFHLAYHSGQLGLLRRLVGMEGAIV